MLGVSPGFYVALGDAELVKGPGLPLVRFYWNVAVHGATALMATLTTRLNAAKVPFEFKIISDRASYNRSDAGVLYVSRDDYAYFAKILRSEIPQLSSFLRCGTPAFTKPLAGGLGLAEDPGMGTSFGQDRCGIVAEGLIRAYEQGASAVGERLEFVLAHFAERGVEVDRPYLNPGSTDTYEFVPIGNAKAAARTWSDTEQRRKTTAEALAIAVDIGNQLCTDALWYRDRCTWIGVVPDLDNVSELRVVIHMPLGSDLYSGTAGVAWFLGELYTATRAEQFRRTALGAIGHAVAALELHTAPNPIGLFHGPVGVAYVAARLGTIMGEDRLRLDAARLVRQRSVLPTNQGQTDLLSGAAGAILGLLAIAQLLDDPEIASPCTELGNHILMAAEQTSPGVSWRTTGAPCYRNLTGYSHGTAGIAHALLELYVATSDGHYRECAELAFDYDRDAFSAEDRNWYDFRLLPNVARRCAWAPTSSLFWCHGAPGIALSRLRALQILGNPQSKAEALIALDTTRLAIETSLATGTVDYSLCHGLAGNAEILGEGRRVLGAEAPGGVSGPAAVARHGIETYGKQAAPWPCGREAPGLMLGLAGIGHFYLRLADSNIPSPLLLSPSALARCDAVGSTLEEIIP
jgi:hypothetical protein